MNLLQRTIAAATLALTAAGFTINQTGLPVEVERAAIIGALMVMTPELEGTRLKAYPDTGGVWTICTGHTSGVRRGDVATRPQCAAYLRDDLQAVVSWVLQTFPKATLMCKVALADMAFNAGRTAVGKSSMARLVLAGDFRGAAQAFMLWMYVAGKDCRDLANNCYGIVKRRMLQRDLCLEGVA